MTQDTKQELQKQNLRLKHRCASSSKLSSEAEPAKAEVQVQAEKTEGKQLPNANASKGTNL